ncbi:MAG: hypothetical protein JNK74_00600 [Candidatus Hydrogenedentes bacterium]|nr:hypothetical protein [Candidatus Hydrogenedentota bacterium]
MNPYYACLPEGESPYLLECWLRTLPPEARVVLLPSDVHGAPEQAALPADPRLTLAREFDAVAARDCPRIHIPVSLERVPMRYRAGVSLPEVSSRYALLPPLWRRGFREAVFVDHGGATVLPMPHLLDGFHHRHRGERCFVVGNGPSLNDIDMTKLKGELTLGSNRCFLGYESWGFPFSYWGVYDKYQIETYHPVYESAVPADTVKFFPAEYWPVMRVAQGCPVNSAWPDPFPRAFSDCPSRVYRGFTVTFMLLQIAAIMGCDPIILIGADHRYELSRRGYSPILRRAWRGVARRLRGGRVYETALAAQRAWTKGSRSGDAALWTTADATRATHFTSDYTDGGKNRFLPPEPEEAERDFDCARRWAEGSGRRILNATPGTALESFPEVDFGRLF